MPRGFPGDPLAVACYQRALDLASEGEKPELRVQKAQAELSGGDVAAASQTLAGLAPPEELTLRVRYLVIRGEVDWMCGDLAAAEKATQAARTLAEENGIFGELVEAVMAQGLVAHSRGGFLELAQADLLKPELVPALATIVHEGHLCVTEGYLSSGRPYEDVARFARELRAAGERSGARRAVAFATCLLGETELLTGALASAAHLLDEAAQMSLSLGAKGAAALARQRRAETALAAGDLAGAKSSLAEALALARETPFGQRHLLLRIYGTRIQAERTPTQALAVVDEAAVGIVGPGESCNACLITFVVPAAIACARGGQRARAESQLALAEQTVQFFWPKGPWQAALSEIRGELAMAAGAWEAATAHFGQAGALYRAAGQRLDAERCRQIAENHTISDS